MNKNGPVIVIEDDPDDQLLLDLVCPKLAYSNQVIYFSDGQQALNYLKTTLEISFLILSDINMPELDGFALRQKVQVDAQLQRKCIPYLFFSTGVSQQMVIDANSLPVQGFFIRHTTMQELKKTSL